MAQSGNQRIKRKLYKITAGSLTSSGVFHIIISLENEKMNHQYIASESQLAAGNEDLFWTLLIDIKHCY
jgi:hypothetical protein